MRATVGATVRFQRDYNSKQPGDAAKSGGSGAARYVLSNPPLWLSLGSDAYNAAEKHF
jgi:hypothetical protein